MNTRTMMLLCASSALAAGGDSSACAQSGKEKMYQQMIALTQQMNELQAHGGNAALIEQLQHAYNAMSESLGGDDPGRMYSTGANTGVPHAPRPPAGDEGGPAGTGFTPAGCAGPVVSAASADTPIAIPDNTTITSTITIAGAERWLWGIEVHTFITHTFAGDLDITLTSPSGRVVTLTTDNGSSFNDVFNGTYWDDDRDWVNTDGQVPYVNNDNLVTDHLYAADGVVGQLVPEEPLNAFMGEDPNGVWTLTVSDDFAADIGNLASWNIDLLATNGPQSGVTRTFRTVPGLAIPDGAGFVASNINVTYMGGDICDVEVNVRIAHTSNSDLDFTLRSPNGRIATLSTDNGGTFDDGFRGTTFSNYASTGGTVPYAVNPFLTTDRTFINLVPAAFVTPEESLGIFKVTPANGVWTLTVSDDLAGNVGTLVDWSITIHTCSCNPPCPGDINGDGVTNVADLLGVISLWGNCP